MEVWHVVDTHMGKYTKEALETRCQNTVLLREARDLMKQAMRTI